MPVQAREHTAGGAAIFAANLIRALDWAYSTTDSSILRQYYAPVCNGCSNSIAIFDSPRSAGLHFSGGHLTTQAIRSNNQLPANGVVVVQVTVAQEVLKTLKASGQIADGPYKPSKVIVEYSVHWSTDQWKVVQILAKELT